MTQAQTTVVRVAARALGVALLVGCGGRQSPLMHGTMLLDPTPPAAAALVVFVRDSNPCDGGAPFRIVDDESRFVGESTPSSKFAVRMQPGHHAFFVWQPFGDLPADLYPGANQVGAIGGDFEAGKTYFVDVGISNDAHGVRKTCFAYQFLAMHFVDPQSPDVAEVVERAAPYVPDVAAGQAEVNRDGRGVAAHLALGMRKLSR